MAICISRLQRNENSRNRRGYCINPLVGFSSPNCIPKWQSFRNHEAALIELKGKMGKSGMAVGDFGTPLSTTSRTTETQKSVKIQKNWTLSTNKIWLAFVHYYDIILYTTTVEQTFFSRTKLMLIKIDDVLGHETHFNVFKRTEVE